MFRQVQFHQRVAETGRVSRSVTRRKDNAGQASRQRCRHARAHQVEPWLASFAPAVPFCDDAIAFGALGMEDGTDIAAVRVDTENSVAERRRDPDPARVIQFHIVRRQHIGQDALLAKRAVRDRQRECIDAVCQRFGHVKRAARLVDDDTVGEKEPGRFQLGDRRRIAGPGGEPEQGTVRHRHVDGFEQAFF